MLHTETSKASNRASTGPKALVLRAAGTNCDGEAVEALERAGARPERIHIAELARHPELLEPAAIVLLPGGFSYGDYVAAGRLFGRELRQRLGDALERHVDRGGFVLGICNGFQVLVELGLLEGLDAKGQRRGDDARTLALVDNASGRFECRWVHLRSETSQCPFLVPGEIWPVPVAHGEGRLVVSSPERLEELRSRGQIALRYVTAEGGQPEYPELPNGSLEEIAGLCDPTGRVLGLMPHPERNQRPWHHPRWTRLGPREEGEGLALFRRLVHLAAHVR